MKTTLSETLLDAKKKRLNALCVTPLSAEFSLLLEKKLHTKLQESNLKTLRHLKPLKLWQHLRNSQDSLFLITQNPQEDTFVGILQILATFTKAKNIYIITESLNAKPTSKFNCFTQIPKFILTSLKIIFSICKVKKEVNFLAKQPIADIKAKKNNNFFHLNANFWLNVVAGGSLGHISGICNTLANNGYQVSYIALASNPTLQKNIKFHTLLPIKNYGVPQEGNIFANNLYFTKQIAQLLQHQKPTVIYQRLSFANYSGVTLSRKFNIPLIVEYNGSEAWISQNWGGGVKYFQLVKKIEDINLQHAQIIVTISNVLRDELIKKGVKPNKIVCYPNCIDKTIFNPDIITKQQRNNLKIKYDLQQDVKIISFIGTFGVWHGADILAKAIVKIIDQDEDFISKNKVKFMLIGDGPMMSTVKNILKDIKYNKWVIFTGLIPQQQAPQYLALADILISPHIKNKDGSQFFGSPTKLFEYMAMGKAIIASDLAQIGEVLMPSIAAKDLPRLSLNSIQTALAVLCQPGNIDDIIAGIKFFIKNPQYSAIMGKNARRVALHKYTWDKHVDAILTKIKEIL